MKILTFQIPEELFQRLKDHLAGRRNGQEKESVRRNSSWLSSSGRWMRRRDEEKRKSAADPRRFCLSG